ncbi:MAG TPA: hypothetical protein VMM76_02270, partial [Pirellulaceae bacterium]|nr:hypothetical protein [Pirellulaceae bacterium]
PTSRLPRAVAQRIQQRQARELPDRTAESIVLRAWEQGLVGARLLRPLMDESCHPAFNEFDARTALVNAGSLHACREGAPATLGDLVPRRALHFVSQTVYEPSVVTVVMKDGPATITARDDLVNRTGNCRRGTLGIVQDHLAWKSEPTLVIRSN